MKFLIKLVLYSGNEIQSKIEAKSMVDALKRVEKNQQVIDFLKNDELKGVHIIPVDEEEVPTDFILQQAEKKGYMIVTDRESLFSATFKIGAFNETVNITPLKGVSNKTPLEMDSVLRQMSDFLYQNHRELIE